MELRARSHGYVTRFNPSRVHLERATEPSADTETASTPQGCIWNARPNRAPTAKPLQPLKGASGTWMAGRLDGLAFTLQPLKGASGTSISVARSSTLAVLQPLKGASGTAFAKTLAGALGMLQPLKGPSGTWNSWPASVPIAWLQPLKGPSGTVEWDGVGRPEPASTPQGCIWNDGGSIHGYHGQRASTPQGCIWNNSKLQSRAGRWPASTPQGCIWNHAHNDRYRCPLG